MSIQSEITRISGNVSDAFTAITNKGVTVPAGSTSDDLADLISQISGGGGASNVVVGTFTTSSSTGTAQTVNISYSGNGHPIYVGVFPNDGYAAGSSLYGITHQYATIEIAIIRSNIANAPTYSGSGTQNQGYVSLLSKGSNTTNTSVSRTNGASIFTSTAAESGAGTTVRFSAKDKMSIFVSSNSYGFLASTTYKYVIVYSS